MRYYPIFLDVQGRRCVVIGGGTVAQRKVETLRRCGALVDVISPALTEGLEALCREGEIHHIHRTYRKGDLEGAFLVIAATDSDAINHQVAEDCHGAGIPVNVVDDPERCTFILPSIVHRGDLVIAISTSGKSPAMAKRIREELEAQFGEEYSRFLDWMGRLRVRILNDPERDSPSEVLFERLIRSGILDSFRRRDRQRVNDILTEVLGPGYSLEELGI